MCLPHVLLSRTSPLCAVLHAELLLSAYSVNGNATPSTSQECHKTANVRVIFITIIIYDVEIMARRRPRRHRRDSKT